MEGLKIGGRKAGRPTKYDPIYCDMVEEEMAGGLSLTAFAGIIGVARSTINEWMAANPDFSEAVNRAKAKRLLQWERKALKVADNGGTGGQSTIIIFGLKNMGGDEWTEKSETKSTVDLNLGPEIHEGMTPAQAAEAFAMALRGGRVRS